MNNVILVGRITKDLEARYTTQGTAVTSFNVAVDRVGSEETDFPKITVFGKQAENCVTHLGKGCRVCVQGQIQTSQYKDKEGKTVYTTDVIAQRVEFLDYKEAPKEEPLALNEEIPF